MGEGLSVAKGGEEEWVLHSPLHVAAYTGDLTKLQAILETGTTWGSRYSIVSQAPILKKWEGSAWPHCAEAVVFEELDYAVYQTCL